MPRKKKKTRPTILYLIMDEVTQEFWGVDRCWVSPPCDILMFETLEEAKEEYAKSPSKRLCAVIGEYEFTGELKDDN